MSNLKIILLVVVVKAVALPAAASDMGLSQGWDLDQLWAAAQENFATDTEDAVLLLESREVTLNGDGTKSTRVHTVVWITSSVGIRGYADLRIPWDTATSELEVEVLRTWMDEQWWPDPVEISETAVVHTLPHALRTAHDYTSMRETMLLHDGVELPCIMETVYTITEQMAFDHADGLMVMARRDPAVRVEMKVTAPGGTEVKHETMNGVPAPVVDNADGQLVLTWAMDNVAALAMPVAASPERYEPAVVWSTWPDWAAVDAAWRGSLDAAAQLAPALEDTLHNLIANHSGLARRLPVFSDWVDETVRPIAYGPGPWLGRPRSALEVFETGYGHALDRAVLFAAVDGAGLYDIPVFFVGPPGPTVAPAVPRLSGLGDLLVGHLTEETLYDPVDGRLVNTAALWGRPAYLVATGPIAVEPQTGLKHTFQLNLALEEGEDGTWSGEGGLLGSGIFADYTQLADGHEAAAGHVGRILGSALPGAEAKSVNPVRLDGQGQSFTFAFTLAAPGEDDPFPHRLACGSPARGIPDRLPAHAGPGRPDRTSPVFGVPMSQTVRLRLRGDGFVPPAETLIENEVGRFAVTVSEDHGWTVIERQLELTRERVEADQWPALRALLLAEQDPRHGTIVLE